MDESFEEENPSFWENENLVEKSKRAKNCFDTISEKQRKHKEVSRREIYISLNESIQRENMYIYNRGSSNNNRLTD